MRGKFITVEGGEGVGKSTNMAFIQAWLDSHDIAYVVTREPGGTGYGEKIRTLLLDHGDEELDPVAELLLIFAARAQHIAKVIEPALKRGVWVLCDRFTDATYAYQGGGRDLGLERVATLESFVQRQLRPDLTLILDVDPQVGMARARDRGELDRFEREQMTFFDKVRQTYLKLAALHPRRYAVIDAERPLDEVQVEIGAVLNQRLLEGMA